MEIVKQPLHTANFQDGQMNGLALKTLKTLTAF